MQKSSQEIILNFLHQYELANKYQYSNPEKYANILWEKIYCPEMNRRIRLLKAVSSDKNNIKATLGYIAQRESIVDWLVDWCWTDDPRNAAFGLPIKIPFIPFPKQIELINWAYETYFLKKWGLIEKTRDVGMTWMFCYIMVREWRWVKGFKGGIGSRVLTLVDDKDNPKAIFEKIRTIINDQPYWWHPKEIIDKIGNLTNKDMNSNLAGEGGDNIGRGDRRAIYLVDEAAFLEHYMTVKSALSRTTNTTFLLSTYNGPNFFYRDRISTKIRVFVFDWTDDPRKHKEWYDEQVAAFDDVIVAQEIDRDPMASVDNIFINPKHIRAAVNFDIPFVKNTPSAGLDVAAGGKNKSALILKINNRITKHVWNFKNGSDLAHKTIEICNAAGIDYLSYDPLGVGHSVHSIFERTRMPMAFDYFPVGAGESPSDMFYEEFGRKAKDVFANAKSEWWYRASVMFRNTYEHVVDGIPHNPSEMISIPPDQELMSQLAAPLKLYTNSGLIQVEPKKHMMEQRGIVSGDEADGFVMSLIPRAIGFNRVWATYSKINHRPVNIDFSNILPGLSQIIAVLYYDKKSGSIFGNMFFWGRKSRILRVYGEFDHHNPIIEVLAADIKYAAKVSLKKNNNLIPYVSRIFCNDDMASGKQDWAFHLRKRAGIRVVTSTNYDEAAAIAIARTMFRNKGIIVDDTCIVTNQEYRNWRILDNKPDDGYFHCRALCIAISELRNAGELREDTYIKPYGKKQTILREKIKNQTLSPVTARILAGGKIPDESDYLAK
jgi:hypothetical protein